MVIVAYAAHVSFFVLVPTLVVPLIRCDDPLTQGALNLLHDCHH